MPCNQTFVVSHYTFETARFGLSDEGLHLLRSGHNYKTLAYRDIRRAILKKGVAIKNWLLVLLLGIGLIAFAVYQASHLYHLFMNPGEHTVNIVSILLPVLPLLLGNYCVYVALKRTTILKVKYRGGKAKLPLDELVTSNEAVEFTTFLQAKLSSRFRVEGPDAGVVLSTNIS